MTDTANVATVTDELVLEPPSPVQPVTTEQAGAKIQVDPETALKISTAVNSFVDSIMDLPALSPEFERKIHSIRHLGSEEIRRSAEASSRFLDRPTAELKNGPIAQGSQVSGALLGLRQQIEALDPSRHFNRKRGLFNRLPMGNQVADYFRRYQ